MVSLGEVSQVIAGQSPEGEYYNDRGEGTPFYQGKIEFADKYIGTPVKWTTQETRIAEKDDILMSVRAPVGPVNISTQRICIGRGLAAIRVSEKILMPYLFTLLKINEKNIKGNGGAVFDSINRKDIEAIPIPLPPLEVQREIVAEIEGYQKLIDGARQVVENWTPHFDIAPDWPIVTLEEIATKITDGTHRTPDYTEDGIPFLRVTDITESNTSKKFITVEEHKVLIKRCLPEKGDVLYSKNGTIGIAKLIDWDWAFSIFVSLALIKPKKDLIAPRFLETFLNSDIAYSQAISRSKSGTVTNLHLVDIKTIKIPVPPLDIQQAIVANIDVQRKWVEGCRELIAIYEVKIKNVINKV